MRNNFRGSVSACLLAFVAGCDAPVPASTASGWAGTIDTISGVSHVRNPDREVWSDGERWRIVEEIRIGRQEGEGPDVFSQIGAIGVSPSGLIHVVDIQSQEIRVFDATGRHVRSIGGRGSGPGEFQLAHGMAWDSLGRLWVVDPTNARYVVFDEEYEAKLHLAREIIGIILPWPGGFGVDGFLYDVSGLIQTDGSIHFAYLRVDSTARIVDTMPPIIPAPGPNRATPRLLEILPRSKFRFDPAGYLWLGESGTYRLIQRTLAGDTVRVIEREYVPLHVTAEERDSILIELAEIPPDFRADFPEVPPVKAVFSRVHVDPDGYLYVQMIGDSGDSTQVYSVHDPEGRYLGNVESELRFTTNRALPIFRGDVVYGVVTDALGVDYVVRARIERPGK